MFSRIFFVMLISIICQSCSFSNKDNVSENEYNTYKQQTKFVGDTIFGLESVLLLNNKLQKFNSNVYSVVIFVDSNCPECIRLMHEWEKQLKMEYPTYFVFSGKAEPKFVSDIEPYPFEKLFDEEYLAVSKNKFWGIEKVFLINKEFEVFAEGNPLVKPELKRIFNYIINGKK